MKPFLKWAGGKRWLAQKIHVLIPNQVTTYIEPFLGSGAIFFALNPEKAILSDLNPELIGTYITIKEQPLLVRNQLEEYHRLHCRDFYYKVRAMLPSNMVEAAARFIYLNRTCWNGLYRVNRRNEFNVPIGTKTQVLLADDDFPAISNVLQRADLVHCDFEATISRASAGDLIYVDPPYTVKHNNNGFLKYNQSIFSWSDQLRLRDSLIKARERGCHIIMSNADHASVQELYEGFAGSMSMPRASVIAGKSEKRGPTSEYLLVHHG